MTVNFRGGQVHASDNLWYKFLYRRETRLWYVRNENVIELRYELIF